VPTPRKKPATDGAAAPKPKAAPRKKAAPKTKADAPAAPPAGKFDLVIVESPAKAKTINKYLGSNYRVLASYGHVRDLDTRKKKGDEVAGIDITGGWKLRYVVDNGDEDGPKGRGKRRTPAEILAEIGREAKQANRVLLGQRPGP
jgi:DNA topoisomerase I